MKLKPELKPELTQTNGFVEVLILGKEYFGKMSNSNYLQTERSSRWSGWRDSNSHLTSNSQNDILFCNFNGFNLVNLTLFELPNLEKRTKISLKLGLFYTHSQTKSITQSGQWPPFSSSHPLTSLQILCSVLIIRCWCSLQPQVHQSLEFLSNTKLHLHPNVQVVSDIPQHFVFVWIFLKV